MTYKIRTQIKTVEIPQIELDGKWFDLLDLLDLLEELVDTSYTSDRIVMYNDDLKNILEKMEVIEVSIRGSIYKGENHQKFFDEVMNIWVGEE